MRVRGYFGAGAWSGPEQAKLDVIETMNFSISWALSFGATGFFALYKMHILEMGTWISRF